MRSILGAVMALAASRLVASRPIYAPDPRRDSKPTPKFFKLTPQSGPVVDTTPESKRARRRRLARERG